MVLWMHCDAYCNCWSRLVKAMGIHVVLPNDYLLTNGITIMAGNVKCEVYGCIITMEYSFKEACKTHPLFNV